MAKGINFDNECWLCGVKERYNVCAGCGVDIYIHGNQELSGTDKILAYLEKTNNDRFKQMIKQYEDI